MIIILLIVFLTLYLSYDNQISCMSDKKFKYTNLDFDFNKTPSSHNYKYITNNSGVVYVPDQEALIYKEYYP